MLLSLKLHSLNAKYVTPFLMMPMCDFLLTSTDINNTILINNDDILNNSLSYDALMFNSLISLPNS